MTPPRHRELFVLFHWSMQLQLHTSVGVESRRQTPDSQRHLPVWNDTWHQTVEYVACLPCQTRFRKARCQTTCHLQLLASYCITDTTNISQCANNWTCSSADNKKQAEVASLQITETHDSLYNKITDAHYSSVSVSIGSYIYILPLTCKHNLHHQNYIYLPKSSLALFPLRTGNVHILFSENMAPTARTCWQNRKRH